MKMFKKDPNKIDKNHLILYVEDDIVKAKCYDEKGILRPVNAEELLSSIDILKNEKIYGIGFSERYTNFKMGSLKVSVENNDKLKNDERLSFVTKTIKNKRYKLQRRKKLIKPILTSAFALTLASVMTLNVSSYVKGKNLPNEELTVPINCTYVDDTLSDFTKTPIINDSVVNIKKDILKQVPKSEEDSTTVEGHTEEVVSEVKEEKVTEEEVTEEKKEETVNKVTPKKVEKNSPTYKVYLSNKLLSNCGSKKILVYLIR